MFFSNTPWRCPYWLPRRIDHRQFFECGDLALPHHARQQMAEFHGEMPSAQSKISLRYRVRTAHIVSRPSGYVTISAALLADAQRALP